MAVRVIKNTEPKNVNIISAAAIGAGAGLAVRQFVTPSKKEIDSVIFSQFEMIKENNIQATKKSVIEAAEKIFSKNPENQELALFLEKAKAETGKQAIAIKKKINAADKAVKEKVKILIDDLAGKMRASKNLSESAIKSYVKQKRPISSVVLPGLALGALGAFVYNVVGKISQD